jgi:hypothetical protein
LADGKIFILSSTLFLYFLSNSSTPPTTRPRQKDRAMSSTESLGLNDEKPRAPADAAPPSRKTPKRKGTHVDVIDQLDFSSLGIGSE